MHKPPTSSSPQVSSQHNISLIKLREDWPTLPLEDKVAAFSDLPRSDSDDFFLSLKAKDQAELILALPRNERRLWIRLLPPDDLTDVIQEAKEARDEFLCHLDGPSRKEVTALLAYAEDEAGGLMNPRFPRIRLDMRVDEALRYLKMQALHLESLRYCYVLDADQKLLGIVSLRGLFTADGNDPVRDIMRTSFITASDTMSQEEIKNLFTASALMSIPVVDDNGRMKGIVTVDDIVEVVEEEATSDIHKLGGSESLDEPYLTIDLVKMIKKRAGWLVVLFCGELFTASAMGYFEHEIARAVVLALFIPLIISSGGNTGSQASTLVVRAIALQEIRLRDWWRVLRREIVVGTSLGAILGAIGFLRICLWPARATLYTEHYMMVALTVATSLLGIVLWGSLAGSMLPFILKRFKLDPATASAPFVATLVDVSGLVIYFTTASFMLRGTLL